MQAPHLHPEHVEGCPRCARRSALTTKHQVGGVTVYLTKPEEATPMTANDTPANDAMSALAKKIITDRALDRIGKAMASVGIARDDLGELPEGRSSDEIPTAVQDAMDELDEIWVALRTQHAWLRARSDRLALAAARGA